MTGVSVVSGMVRVVGQLECVMVLQATYGILYSACRVAGLGV